MSINLSLNHFPHYFPPPLHERYSHKERMRPVGITQKKAAGKYFPVPLRHAIICAMPHINHGDKRIVSKEFVIAAQLQSE